MPSISDKCICCGSSKLKKKQSILSPFFTYRMFNYTPLKIKRKQFNDIKHGYTYYACQTIECLNCGLVFLDQVPSEIILTAKLKELLGSRGENWEILTTGAFVSMTVPLFIFFALQRYFIRGLVAGSVKG